MKRTILCYGDSNTWGRVPNETLRLPREARWAGVMDDRLGNKYEIVEDGVKGRTTIWDDPNVTCANGLTGLGYALCRTRPLDLVIVMLGTNDLHHTDADGFGVALTELASRLLQANEAYPDAPPVFRDEARVLLISPILVYPELCPPDPNAAACLKESKRFAEVTARVAAALNVPWLDAAKYARASNDDGWHMDEENHRLLGEAVAQKVRTLLG